MATNQQPTFEPAISDPGEHHGRQTWTCLGCGRPFISAHVGHRIYRQCKALDVWKSGTADFESHDGFRGRTTPWHTA
jgi:hypothetical protein